MARPRTVEELNLLIGYVSVLGIWFAIPSVSLLLNRDKRWPYAIILLLSLVLFLVISYLIQWQVLFPRSASEIVAFDEYKFKKQGNIKYTN